MIKIIDAFWFGNKNLIHRALKKPIKPRWMWFAVTDKCNSRCSHCQIWQQAPEEKPLSVEEIKEILSDPFLKNIQLIINSGGEAILHPQILEILRIEHQLFPKATLNISTNAILADRVLTITKQLLQEGVKLNLGVSLDGIGENHDKIRGIPGNFKKVDYLLKSLVSLRKIYPHLLTITVGFTLSSLTIENYQDTKKYTDDLNVELMIQHYDQSSFYSNEQDNINNKTINNGNNKIKEIVKSQVASSTQEKWLRLLNNKSIKFNCFATDTFLAMKCNGDIIPCLAHWDVVLGNPRNSSITQVLTSDKAREIKKIITQCPGCLNSWGLNWSLSSSFYPRLLFFIKNPKILLDRVRQHYKSDK